jgi:sporulation protein YlmC with PRC-barrel domain
MNPIDHRMHRLSDLLGATVVTDDGEPVGHVNDVRLAPGQAVQGVRAELLVEGIVVSDRHAGSMLGYDRRDDQGPWLVRILVRRAHRNAQYLPWSAIQGIEWDERRLVVKGAAQPLTPA